MILYDFIDSKQFYVLILYCVYFILSLLLNFSKLIAVLKYYIDNAHLKDMQDILLKAMKSMEYIFKFIVRSRQLFAA